MSLDAAFTVSGDFTHLAQTLILMDQTLISTWANTYLRFMITEAGVMLLFPPALAEHSPEYPESRQHSWVTLFITWWFSDEFGTFSKPALEPIPLISQFSVPGGTYTWAGILYMQFLNEYTFLSQV